MCVIFNKPSGVSLPCEKAITSCINSNRHGVGIMFPHKNRVYIRKGWFTRSDIYKGLQEVVKLTKKPIIDIPLVMHFRAATSGKVSPENCHPFPNSHKVKWLTNPSMWWDSFGVAHNGIFMIKDGDGKLSDTQMFILKYMSKYTWYDFKYGTAEKDLYPEISWNRLILMNTRGNTHLIGHWYKDTEGRDWTSPYMTGDTSWENNWKTGWVNGYNDMRTNDLWGTGYDMIEWGGYC